MLLSFLLFPKDLLYTVGSLNTEFSFCIGRGCLLLSHSEVCQRKSYLLIFKKDIAKRLWPLHGRAGDSDILNILSSPSGALYTN